MNTPRHGYETLELRPMRDYEITYYRNSHCSTPKCQNTPTHVRIVVYQHYPEGCRDNGRREKRLNICAECATQANKPA